MRDRKTFLAAIFAFIAAGTNLLAAAALVVMLGIAAAGTPSATWLVVADIASLVLALIVSLLGLIFSIQSLIKARKRQKKMVGQILSIIGQGGMLALIVPFFGMVAMLVIVFSPIMLIIAGVFLLQSSKELAENALD